MDTYFIIQNKRIPVTLNPISIDRIQILFKYFPPLIEEIKSMQGAKWHGYLKSDDPGGSGKYWTILNSSRNWFTIHYLMGKNPYTRYDQQLIEIDPNPNRASTRSLYKHQLEGLRFVGTRRQCLLIYEMRLGKTLIIIELLEYLYNNGFIKTKGNHKFLNKTVDPDKGNRPECVWIGPRSALIGVNDEFDIWKAEVIPQFYTYDSLKNAQFDEVPKVLILDEISKIKSPSSQRSQCVMDLAEKMRAKYFNEAVIIGLTGTPQPNSPLDWYVPCEVCCPGFLREGSYEKFRNRLGLIEKMESVTGGAYPRLVTWWDDENKCRVCGKHESSFDHDPTQMFGDTHQFQKSTNEVHKLYERMKGLVDIKFKEDCLDLPAKRHRIIKVTPTDETIRAEKLIIKSAPRAITALTLCRELSDGFQYRETETDEVICCELCNGSGTILQPIWTGPQDTPIDQRVYIQDGWQFSEDCCTKCLGKKVTKRIVRNEIEVECPKDKVILDLLEEYEDIGRFVIYGGFTGTVNRLTKLCSISKWNFIRVDGRGWITDLGNGDKFGITGTIKSDQEMYSLFKDAKSKQLFPRIVFIAQADSGGMGIDLSASPICVFYSNSFKGESRMQAEERIYGPRQQRGCEIIDIIHLDSDQLVLDNIQKKKDLQLMSLGELNQSLSNQDNSRGIRYV